MPNAPDKTRLDRAIEAVFPEWGLRRAAARQMMSAVDGITASYRGGVSTRLEPGWSAYGGVSGQSVIDFQALDAMRERSRDVDRNNAIGQGVLNRLVDNIVGEGFTLQATTVSDAFNREAEARWWNWWNDKAHIRGMLPGPQLERLLCRAYLRDGDVGSVLVDRGGVSRVQPIEADQIANPDGRFDFSIKNGVEVNRLSRPLAFHVKDADAEGRGRFARIPAENFVYLPRLMGLNDTRGTPAFAPVFTQLNQLDGYMDAVTVAARMAAVFGLIFKEESGQRQFNALNTLTNSQGNQQRAITLENGAVKFVGRDDQVVQVNPQQPMQQTPEFVSLLMRIIGLPFNMPLELVMLRFDLVNFSSARASFLQFYRSMRPEQNYFAAKILTRIYQWWLSRAVNDGEFTTPAPAEFWPHEFMPRGWQWVDPVKEVQAALLEVSLGVNSRRRICATLGRDPDEIMLELAAEAAAAKAAGLPEVLSTLTRDAAAAADKIRAAAAEPGNDDEQDDE